MDDEDIRLRRGLEDDAAPLHFEDEALDPAAEPHAARRWAAQEFHQPVVASAAAQRALRAFVIGADDFENGAVVVVEPADKQWVDADRYAGRAERLLHGAMVRLGLWTEAVDQLRRARLGRRSRSSLLSSSRKGLRSNRRLLSSERRIEQWSVVVL